VAGSKKKVGGIKARGKASPRVPVRPVATSKERKVDGVTAAAREAASSKHRWCARDCEGEFREGMWCHLNWCSELRMIWKAHGQTLADWMCFYGCPGQGMPSGWTHHAECEFWDRHPELTPFHTKQEEKQCLQHLMSS